MYSATKWGDFISCSSSSPGNAPQLTQLHQRTSPSLSHGHMGRINPKWSCIKWGRLQFVFYSCSSHTRLTTWVDRVLQLQRRTKLLRSWGNVTSHCFAQISSRYFVKVQTTQKWYLKHSKSQKQSSEKNNHQTGVLCVLLFWFFPSNFHIWQLLPRKLSQFQVNE